MLQPLLLALVFYVQSGDVLSAPALAKPVTFATRAEDAVTAMKALGQAAGAPLAATQGMESEILILRLDKVPLRDAMRKIADACGGSWSLEKGVYTLGRSSADEARRLSAARAPELAAFQKIIADAKARLAAEKPFDEAAATMLRSQMKVLQTTQEKNPNPSPSRDAIATLGLTSQEPLGRFIDAALIQLDPAALLDTTSGRRTVFSTDANSMEVPLNIDLLVAVDEFLSEQSLWSDIAKRPESNGISFATDRALTGQITKLDVVVDRMTHKTPSLIFELIGPRGNIVIAHEILLAPDPVLPDAKAFGAKSGETPLVVSNDERAEMQLFAASLGSPRRPTPMSAAALSRLSQPDRYDPLSTYVSSLDLEAAEALGTNLVADVPDGYIMLGPAAGAISLITTSSWLKMIESFGSVFAPICVDEKWIEISSGQVASTSLVASRADRHLLANLIADAKSSSLTAEVLGRYVFETNHALPDFMSMAKIQMLGQNLDFHDWDTLRLFGALEQHEGAAALKSHVNAFTSLDTATINLLTEIAFYHQPPLAIANSPDVGGEPCDMLPQGLPRDGSLIVTSFESDVVFPDGLRSEPVSASDLAYNTYKAGHPDSNQDATPGPTMSDKFRTGTLRTIRIEVRMRGAIGPFFEYHEDRPRAGDAVPFTSLPPKFIASVKKELSEIENGK